MSKAIIHFTSPRLIISPPLPPIYLLPRIYSLPPTSHLSLPPWHHTQPHNSPFLIQGTKLSPRSLSLFTLVWLSLPRLIPRPQPIVSALPHRLSQEPRSQEPRVGIMAVLAAGTHVALSVNLSRYHTLFSPLLPAYIPLPVTLYRHPIPVYVRGTCM